MEQSPSTRRTTAPDPRGAPRFLPRRPSRSGRRHLAGAALVLSLAAAPAPLPAAGAGDLCRPRAVMLGLIAEELGPTARALGVSDTGNAVELHVAAGGRWVLLVTTPELLSCIVGVGPAWLGPPEPPAGPPVPEDPAAFSPSPGSCRTPDLDRETPGARPCPRSPGWRPGASLPGGAA